jgi:conjugal transfer ATP-binding protein TraC
MINTDILADYLEVWGFQDDYVIFADGSLGLGVELSTVDVSCWDNDQINSIAGRTCQLLNALPSGIDIQFVQDIVGGNKNRIEEHQALRVDDSSAIASRLVDTRSQRLTEIDEGGHLPKHRLLMFIRQSAPGSLSKKPRLFGKPKNFQSISEGQLQKSIAKLGRTQEDIVENLKSLGIASSTIRSDELMDLMYNQWNPTRSISRPPYDSDDVRSSVLFSDLGIDQQGFTLGTMHHRVITLKSMPDQTFASMARVLRDLPFDSRLFLTINVPDQQGELESLQTQRRIAFSMVHGKQNGVSDIESTAKLEDLETILEQMIAQGEKIFRVSLNILLRSSSEDVLDRQVSDVLMKVRELAGAEAMEETLAAFDVFKEIALPNARAKERAKRMKTSELADFLPLYGPWSGHEKPSILLRSRMGSLVNFDPFDKNLANANQIVSGGSGSGKSFMTNILMLQTLKENPKIYIIDIGGSYKKLCNNLGGQYIPLGVESGMSFDLQEGQDIPDNHKIKFLVSLIEIMTKEDGDGRLPRLWRAEIEDAVAKVYEKHGSPSFSHLREELAGHFDSEIKRFGRTLAPWCGNTPFGQFVDRPTTVQLEKQLVCFDLKGLDSYPDLQAACLFIITDFVWREVQADKSNKKFLIFDECWRLLENEAGAMFIGDVFRTFRKYYASAIAISQNIDDFAQSRIANAILPNASTKWVLKQKGADRSRLQEVLDLNDNELSLVESLHQERGKYSEAFLMSGDDRSVVAIESTPLEYWIATTDPRETSLIEKAAKEDPSLSELEILESLATKYPMGLMGQEVRA